jgi:hypothetical protein
MSLQEAVEKCKPEYPDFPNCNIDKRIKSPNLDATSGVRGANVVRSYINTVNYRIKCFIEGKAGAVKDRDIKVLSKNDPQVVSLARILESSDINLYLTSARDAVASGKVASLIMCGGMATGVTKYRVLEGGKACVPSGLSYRGEELSFAELALLAAENGSVSEVIFNASELTKEAIKSHLVSSSLVTPDSQPEIIADHLLLSKVTKTGTAVAEEFISMENVEEVAYGTAGHGNILVELFHQGILDNWVANGIEWLSFSNVDNGVFQLDQAVLGLAITQKSPFIAMGLDREEQDKKGGHFCKKLFGKIWRITTRESAQKPSGESNFEDHTVHSIFNSGSGIVHLPSLIAMLRKYDGLPPIEVMSNEKPTDPTKPISEDNPPSYLLETAMIHLMALVNDFVEAKEVMRRKILDPLESFLGIKNPLKMTDNLATSLVKFNLRKCLVANTGNVGIAGYDEMLGPIRVVIMPREATFAPWKTTEGLLKYWSGVYEISDRLQVVIKNSVPVVELDKTLYKGVEQVEDKIGRNTLNLSNATKFKLSGDVIFEQNRENELIIEGEVIINNTNDQYPLIIPKTITMIKSGNYNSIQEILDQNQ